MNITSSIRFLNQFNNLGSLIFILIVFLNITKISLNSNLIDLSTRLQLDDFFINLYYSYWTQFTYIPTLALVILVIYRTTQLPYFPKNQSQALISFLLISVLGYNTVDYFWSGASNLPTNLTEPFAYNILLINPVNKYHPPLLYVTWLGLLNLCLRAKLNNLRHPQTLNTNQFNEKSTSLTLGLLLLFTLYLGGWWALQEGSWGGWWNWDPSEVLGLFSFTVPLITLHIFWGTTKKITHTMLWVVGNLLILLYLLTQVNFTFISHNFGIRSLVSTFFIAFQILTLSSLAYLVLTLINLMRELARPWTNQITTPQNNPCNRGGNSKVFFVTTVLLATTIIKLAVTPLISNFLWTTFGLNWFSTGSIILKHLTYLYFLLFSMFWGVTTLGITTLVLSGWFTSTNLFLRPGPANYYMFHFLTLTYIFLPNYFFSTDFLVTSFMCGAQTSFQNCELVRNTTKHLIGADNFILQTTTPVVRDLKLYVTSTVTNPNLMGENSSTNFRYHALSDYSTQSLSTGTYITKYLTKTYDIYTSTVQGTIVTLTFAFGWGYTHKTLPNAN